jgi:hypothetical protein
MIKELFDCWGNTRQGCYASFVLWISLWLCLNNVGPTTIRCPTSFSAAATSVIWLYWQRIDSEHRDETRPTVFLCACAANRGLDDAPKARWGWRGGVAAPTAAGLARRAIPSRSPGSFAGIFGRARLRGYTILYRRHCCAHCCSAEEA